MDGIDIIFNGLVLAKFLVLVEQAVANKEIQFSY